MKNISTLDQVIGKTISGVAVSERMHRGPRNQIFLLFDDGSSLEIWGDDLRPASGLDQSDLAQVVSAIENTSGQVLHGRSNRNAE